MGLIICPIHGESGFCMRFSKKIIEIINFDKLINENDLVIFKIIVIDDEDNEVLLEEEYLLLNSEFSLMNSDAEVTADSENAYDFYRSKLPELGGVCFNCLKDYKKKHNLSLLNFN